MASTITGEMDSSLPLPGLVSYTVAGLPAPSAYPYAQAIVTNALATPITGLGLAPVAGGANIVKVWSNGTAWLIG